VQERYNAVGYNAKKNLSAVGYSAKKTVRTCMYQLQNFISQKLKKLFERKFQRTFLYTGWQRYFRNDFNASPSRQKIIFCINFFPQNHLSCLPKHNYNQKITFQQR
jgi:hypothetical protein